MKGAGTRLSSSGAMVVWRPEGNEREESGVVWNCWTLFCVIGGLVVDRRLHMLHMQEANY